MAVKNFYNNEEDEITINIQDILHILRANIIIIIASMLAFGAIFGCYSVFMITPTYSAQSRIYVLSGTDSSLLRLSELEMSTQLAADYVEMMLSRPMLEEVIDELSIGDRYTASSLAVNVSIVNPEDTRILNVTVVGTDPVLAADIANTLADVSARNISDIMETDAPKVFQRAVVEARPIAPDNAKNTLIGMILGAALAVGVIFLFYITDDTIKTEEDIARYAGLATLGTISDDPSKTGGKRRRRRFGGSYGYGYGNYGGYSSYGGYGAYGGYGSYGSYGHHENGANGANGVGGAKNEK